MNLSPSLIYPSPLFRRNPFSMDLPKENPLVFGEGRINPFEKIRPHDHNGADAPQVRFSRLRFDNYQLPTVYGGTGASAVSAARANLGLAIGTNVEAWDVALDDLAGLTLNTGDMFYVSANGHIVDLAIGSSGQVLTVSASGVPVWSTSSGGTTRRNLNVLLDVNRMSLSGTNPTNVTTLNGIQASTNSSDTASAGSITVQTEASWDLYDKNPEFNVNIYYSAGSATGNGKIFAGDTGSSANPTETQTTKCMMVFGDTVAGTLTWYAVNANGTTNTNSSLSSITAAQENLWRVVKNSSTNIKWYTNYTLKATHTTNLPSGDAAGGSLITMGTRNDSGDTTTRTAIFGFLDVLLDSPTG